MPHEVAAAAVSGARAAADSWVAVARVREGKSVIRAVVRFEDVVPDDVQAKAMFDFEVALRRMSGADVRVFKERMGDDSKLRVVMDARRKK